MGGPKRHHVVARFYQRRFAVDDHIQLVSRDQPRSSKLVSVSNAIVHEHFYSVQTPDGRDPVVEKFFADHVEPEAARAIRRLVDEDRFPPLDGLRNALSLFLAFQFVRGDALRGALTEQYSTTAKQFAKLMTPEIARRHLRDADGVEPTDADVDDLLAFAQNVDDYRVVPSSDANLHIDTMMSIVLDLVPYFAKRHWQLLTFDEPSLITGDEPITLIGKSHKPGFEALGVATAREIVFPTDPNHALVLARPRSASSEARRPGTPTMARIINANLGFGCNRFLIHKPGTDPLKGLSFAKRESSVVQNGGFTAMRIRPPRRRG